MTESCEEAVHSANYSHSNDRLTQQRMLATVAEVIVKALDTNDYHSVCGEEAMQTKEKETTIVTRSHTDITYFHKSVVVHFSYSIN